MGAVTTCGPTSDRRSARVIEYVGDVVRVCREPFFGCLVVVDDGGNRVLGGAQCPHQPSHSVQVLVVQALITARDVIRVLQGPEAGIVALQHLGQVRQGGL